MRWRTIRTTVLGEREEDRDEGNHGPPYRLQVADHVRSPFPRPAGPPARAPVSPESDEDREPDPPHGHLDGEMAAGSLAEPRGRPSNQALFRRAKTPVSSRQLGQIL